VFLRCCLVILFLLQEIYLLGPRQNRDVVIRAARVRKCTVLA
jgi:hypothetical protein